jgi:hypothetical protein
MELQGQLSSDSVEIKKYVQAFYQQIFNSEGPRIGKISDEVWNEKEKFLEMENTAMIIPFPEDEIKKTLFQMQGTKTPGPYGLPILFYQYFWPTFMEYVVKLFEAFHEGK